MDQLNNRILYLHIDDSIYIIQKIIRRYLIKINRLPNVLYVVKQYLQKENINCSKQNEDGRINSCYDEEIIISKLTKLFNDRIYRPRLRMWYDILLLDYKYGWIPVNIKTTTTKTNDNTGNLTMCVYAYTNEVIDIKQRHDNGKMSKVLIENLKNKKYNNNRRDYYFLIVNKCDSNDIIINSILGLSILTPNINNLPFQVCWDKNRDYDHDYILKKINMFIECLKKPNPSWKETFMDNIREL